MKGFCPLASGSKGNALYLGTEKTKLLIDAGISYRALKEKLSKIGVAIEEIDAALITHEHVDHIRGLNKLCSTLQLPVLANSETAKMITYSLNIDPDFRIFSTGEPFVFGDIEISPFSIQHDTLDPVAFTFCAMGAKVGVCTDLGVVTTLVVSHLHKCDYLYVEANHDPSMVYTSLRPFVYKKRVLGRQGHLSNQACAQLLKEIKHPYLKHVYLAHLSKECNHPELAIKKVREHLGREIPISIAHQENISTHILFNS